MENDNEVEILRGVDYLEKLFLIFCCYNYDKKTKIKNIDNKIFLN